MEKIEALKNEALEMLREDESLFCEMVNELDNWDGFADGFRAYEMWEIDDLFCNCKVSDFLDKLTSDFCSKDNYICDTIYGLSSCNDIAEWYKDHTDEEEVLENVIENKNNIYFSNPDFEALIDAIANCGEEDEEREGKQNDEQENGERMYPIDAFCKL